MIGERDLDNLIQNERRAVAWFLAWFILVVLVGVVIIVVNLMLGLLKELGPALGSGFVLMLAKPPLSEVLKRRDRIAALQTLRHLASIAEPESEELARIEEIVMSMFKKALET